MVLFWKEKKGVANIREQQPELCQLLFRGTKGRQITTEFNTGAYLYYVYVYVCGYMW